ncbi:hypothetical protein MKZ12_20005 [Paenibacillus sp. FSL R5-0713]|uniref:hypothetical protein n=1 Tax=Paenibacillus sp. FSL R5-0713 TaxID=2921655 RepID=UPI0030DB296D
MVSIVAKLLVRLLAFWTIRLPASGVPCVHSIIRFCYTLGEFNNTKTKLCTPEEAYHEIH